MMRCLFAALAAVAFACALCGSSVAQNATPQASPGATSGKMTQEEMDSLVKAITKSVLEKLKAERALEANPPAPKHTPFDASSPDEPDEVAVFLKQTTSVLEAVPTLGAYLESFARALDRSGAGGRGTSAFLLFLAIAVAASLSAEAMVRAASRGLRSRVAALAGPVQGLRSLEYLGTLLLLDAVGVFAFWLVGRGFVALWFAGTSIPDRFAAALLLGLLFWRLYLLLFRAVLRPRLAAARLCDVQDEDARRLYRLTSAFLLLAILLRLAYYVLAALQAPPEAIAAGRLLIAPLLLLFLIWIVVRAGSGARQWLVGLGQAAPVVGFVGRHWVGLAISFFTLVIATQAYGAISGRAGVPAAMILTLNLALGLIFFETLLQAVVRRLDSQLDGYTPAADRPKLADVVARCVRVAVLIGIVVVLAESWVVDVLRLVNENAWDRLTRAGRIVGLTLFTTFVAWELFRYATDAYVGRLAQQNAGTVGSIAVATRFDTLMPMIRITVAVILLTIALLIALGNLGVDIGPLLAGASVVGLAISFGSQTLVRDIVSGIFYLADDAFRVGEYIDCGRAKGTVEGFTLRSIRLRHQNGQIHTIPFGSLGQITNFSRDWTAVKFNLPFARDTDLEKLRKAAKKIGAELMEDPELKNDLIEPFKMQGVAEITDTAMLVRFKFTARPGNPNAIQNKAVTRLLQALPDLGISLSASPVR